MFIRTLISRFRVNNESAMHGCSSPVVVSVPPERPFFFVKHNGLSEILLGLDGTLRNIRRTIVPWIVHLPRSVPARGVWFNVLLPSLTFWFGWKTKTQKQRRKAILPVNCDAVISFVHNSNDDSISLVRPNCRTREAAIGH